MKHAQAAAEFIITYGIAFVIIFGAVTAMYSMGIIDLTIFYKESCSITPQVVCEDIKATTTGMLNLVIKNTLGTDMNDVEIKINSTKCTGEAAIGSIAKNQRYTLNMDCGTLFFENEKIKGSFVVKYKNQKTQEIYQKVGSFSIRAEKD